MIFLTFATPEDKNKFEYIYEKYKRLLWYKAYDILKDHNMAEDATSEAFIRVYKHLHKIDDPDSNQTVAFLVTIVKNIAINQYNRNKKATFVDISEHEEADSFDLEAYIVNKDAAVQVMEALEELSEELRAVFLLKYAHDLPHKEIASILGITENNVTVRVHRAKAKLAKLVKEGEQA
ncbi:MAG: RNA polymerase sigma factor [Defluviitaleaceae bacterium]|nr:RNA polymerase sigma factor [Defluviitaleaceae bacterium]